MFLSAGDKLMPEMHLTQPGITYSACRPFAKNKEKNTQKFKETEDSQYIYQKDYISLLSTWHEFWTLKGLN